MWLKVDLKLNCLRTLENISQYSYTEQGEHEIFPNLAYTQNIYCETLYILSKLWSISTKLIIILLILFTQERHYTLSSSRKFLLYFKFYIFQTQTVSSTFQNNIFFPLGSFYSSHLWLFSSWNSQQYNSSKTFRAIEELFFLSLKHLCLLCS
jgi:hypothetical protein